jgi:hypothetical protein
MKPENMREQHVPHESEKPLPRDISPNQAARRKAGTVQPGIADADKKARTGTVDEPVRNTPPGGEWNEDA